MYFKRKNIAIIGCGYWGTNLTKTLLSFKNSNIYCYDSNYYNVLNLKKRFPKIIAVKTLREILLNGSIKLVFISIPTSKTYLISKKCIENKKNVFIEKPVSKEFKKINKLLLLSKLNKVSIMVGYIYIYNKYVKYIKKKIQNNYFGKISYIEFNRKNYGPIRSDVSSLWDLASHDISIVHFIFNKRIKNPKFFRHSITKKNNYDNYTLNFEIRDIEFQINASWLYPEKLRQILIVGEKKILLFDELNLEAPIKIFKKITQYPKANQIPSTYFNPQKSFNIIKPFIPKFKNIFPLKSELKYCLNKIYNKQKITTDIKFALNVAKDLKKFE
jgi:predicted dehydrogenase